MKPIYVSVDIETTGPSPANHSLLAIGACLVDDPGRTFYLELQPDRPGVDERAVRISGMSLQRLAEQGAPAGEAMHRFADWVDTVGRGSRPIFLALNAPFDWMFVADYFHRYVGRNPFGHSAIDIKALYMGVTGAAWPETSFRHMAERYGVTVTLPHHALEDAVIQAALFRQILDEVNG